MNDNSEERQSSVPQLTTAPTQSTAKGKQQTIQPQTSLPSTESGTVKVIEQIVTKGNLNDLTSEQRLIYYNEMCALVGLNPLSIPFAFLATGGQLKLYALKSCTDQLRKIHNLSVAELTITEMDNLLSVRCTLTSGERTDSDIGVVSLQGLSSSDKANAMMKAVTKAKRRATLSFVGLSMLDESELDTMNYSVISPNK